MSTTKNQSILNKARSDKFLFVLTLPPVLHDINTNILSPRTDTTLQEDTLQFSVWGSVVPRISVPNKTLRWGGQAYNITSQSRPEYTPITINFNIDNYYNNYWVLWKWLDVMNTIKDSGMDEYFSDKNIESNINILSEKYTDYQTNITIYGLDEFNHKVIQFDYSNSFITDLGEIRYNYRNDNEIESNFTFVFNQLSISLLNTSEQIGT